MSRRTQWRSVIEIILGLLKNFLKTSKERRLSGAAAIWLYSLSSTWLLLEEAFVCLGAGAVEWHSPGTTMPGWASRPSSVRGADNHPTSNELLGDGGPKGKTFKQESLGDPLLLNEHHSKCESSLPKTEQLFLSHRAFTGSSSTAGRSPGKEALMRYQKRN